MSSRRSVWLPRVILVAVAVWVASLGASGGASATTGGADRQTDRGSVTVALAGGGRLVLPLGALPKGANIVVRPLALTRRHRLAGLSRAPVRIELEGAKRLRLPARIEYPYDPKVVPHGAKPSRWFRIATYNERKKRWRLIRTRADSSRRVVYASLKHFSIWGIIDEAEQLVGQILGLRVSRPTCPLRGRGLPGWVHDVNEPASDNSQIFACAQPNQGNLELRVTNNRSYAMWLGFSGNNPKWVWQQTLNMWNTEFADLVDNWHRTFSRGEVLIPPGATVHLGFADGPFDVFTLRARPARDLSAPAAAYALLASDVIGLKGPPLVAAFLVCQKAISTRDPLALARALLIDAFTCGLEAANLIASQKIKRLGKPPPWLAARVRLMAIIQRFIAALSVHHAASDVWELIENRSMSFGVMHSPRTQPQPPPPQPPPQPPPPQPPPPTQHTLTVYNQVTNGSTAMREDTSPAYLSTRMENFCRTRGCMVPGTERWTGGLLGPAICQAFGARTTNGQDNSSIDDNNPGLFTSTRWYGVDLGGGALGYISEVWIQQRGGLGLRSC